MPRRSGRELAVGSFAALALLVLALAVMSVGTDSHLFVDTVEYRVVFPDTGGLRAGSPVKLAGVQVGSVRGIELPADPGSTGIEVRLGIQASYGPRIRADSKAAIRYLQLVSGEKYVEVTPGTEAAGALAPGGVLMIEQGPEFLEQGKDIAQDLGEVTAALNDILRPLREGRGLLGELIQDPDFGREGLDKLRGTLDNLEALTADLRRGRGFVGRALTDPEFALRIDDLAVALQGLREFVGTLERHEGALGALTEEGGSADRAIDDLAAAAASLRRVAERLERPEGLLGRLLNDREWSEGLASDVRETVHHASEITRKIDEGEGTIGALVNERVVHDGLEEVVAGVNDSKFARWLMRHYQKKGIKIETEAEEGSGDDGG
jgi:phospholipid/cholesterol/gamma-HCH transport system substrate-binding protein